MALTAKGSHGFLGFRSAEGLSGFDGYRFADYGVDERLPDARVTCLVETRDGEYGLATASGISRLPRGSSAERNPAGGRRGRFFEAHRLQPDGQSPPRRPLQLEEAPDAAWGWLAGRSHQRSSI